MKALKTAIARAFRARPVTYRPVYAAAYNYWTQE